MPGIIFSCVLLYVHVIAGNHVLPQWVLAVQLILPPYNALYYAKQATSNYAVHYMLNLLGQDELIRKHIEQRTSVTTGFEVMAWKDAIAVPQRGS